MTGERPKLRALAARLGIEEGYVSALDERFVATSDLTRERLVGAMGCEASSEAAAERALAQLEAELASDAGPGPPTGAPPLEPTPCLSVGERLGDARVFGLWTNLYTLRSSRNWGFGNLGDLSALVRHAAGAGAAFVGLNPLHAVANREDGLCPYAPISRLFRNPLYLDVERLLEEMPARQGPAARPQTADLRAASELDSRTIEERVYRALRPLHRALWEGRAPPGRSRAFAAYREAQGHALTSFATFQALADELEPTVATRDWRRWPSEYRTPDSRAVRSFAEARAQEVDFHAWLQFELDEQLGGVAEETRRAGMALGLYTDLALGSAAGGFDTWAYRELFVPGVSVGAPPDAFSRSGQDWGFPPMNPRALQRDGFGFWRRVLDANLRGAAAIRIDHALGLRRLFWLPEDARPGEGAYVRYPEAALLSVLGESSRKHGALVIAEDLGTVPEGFSREIRACGLLSSRVLLFERDRESFRPSDAWPRECLATLNTHDLPPLAGWLAEDDIGLRRKTGQIPDDSSRDAILAERRADRDALRTQLVAEDCLRRNVAQDDPDEWIAATTRFLGRTPAALVGLSLDDLAGERTPINLPGVPPARHRSWVRRMRPTLDELFGDPRARRVLDAVPPERRHVG